MHSLNNLAAAAIGVLLLMGVVWAHDLEPGPDRSLIQQWVFHPRHVSQGKIAEARGKVTAEIRGDASVAQGPWGHALGSDGLTGQVVIADDHAAEGLDLPQTAVTVACWASVSIPSSWGGLVGVLQDNGNAEAGWVLGYVNDRWSFALAAADTPDEQGDGTMTYLTSPQPYSLDTWYHVAGSFDGTTMRLFVNGEEVASSTEQSGPILYPDHAPMVIGAYRDANEFFPHSGAIQHVRLHDEAFPPEHMTDLVRAYPSMEDAAAPRLPMKILVGPYLQRATDDGMTVMWETTRPASAAVEYGTTSDCADGRVDVAELTTMHEIELTGLGPQSDWFYQVRSTDEHGQEVVSEVLTLQTLVVGDNPIAFVVVGDTQNNPAVTAMMSEFAWSHRPHFIMHLGDLVGTGTAKREWVHEFFGSTGDLLGRYPIYPTLGNHERDAQLYYDYFSLPDPEYFYDYRWGNVHVFVIDANKDVSPASDQYQWLKNALSESDAKWKIVQHHQPAFTSDENDYGNTWEDARVSTHGDRRLQEHMVPLYEQFGVDVVFNGHVHFYERTWPLLEGRVDQENGVTYVTSAGGGGHLEDFAPTRVWFSAQKFRGHHFCIVTVHDDTFDLRAFDQDGKLIDFMILRR